MATQAIDVLVQRVARQIRQRRAEHHALRGTFWGTLVAALLLVFKASLGTLSDSKHQGPVRRVPDFYPGQDPYRLCRRPGRCPRIRPPSIPRVREGSPKNKTRGRQALRP